MKYTFTVTLTEDSFIRYVGRPPKNQAEFEEFHSLYELYEWEEMVCWEEVLGGHKPTKWEPICWDEFMGDENE